jgi:hypothetical protein
VLVVQLFLTGRLLLWGQFLCNKRFFRFLLGSFVFSFTVIVFILFRPTHLLAYAY